MPRPPAASVPVVRAEDIPVYPDGTTTRRGIAAYFGVSLTTVDEWTSARKIPFQRRTSRMLRFKIAEVEKALAKLTVKERSR